ncbi:MAG TPA: hypothetical protein VLC09_12155 [Polyangiaceae bacterium]|nr:hypothetical protein [Polyangiaceae bacterium]
MANEATLEWLLETGGSYVWEDEIFAVTALDIELDDAGAQRLATLAGVEQIAINAKRLSFEGLRILAAIPELASLVISECPLSEAQLEQLRALGPEVDVIVD